MDPAMSLAPQIIDNTTGDRRPLLQQHLSFATPTLSKTKKAHLTSEPPIMYQLIVYPILSPALTT